MRFWNKANSKSLIILLGVIIGAGLFIIAKMTQKGPEHDPLLSPPVFASAIKVTPANFLLQAKGFGISQSAETWKAIANVAGRVVSINPELESGVILKKGTELLKLDPSRYQLVISEIKADIASLSAELTQLNTEYSNTEALLSLAKERLRLSEKELSRFEKLAKKEVISISKKDETLRTTLAQRQEVRSLENQMALFPSRFENLKSKRLRALSKLDQAQLNLKDTVFLAPYDLRIKIVNVEQHQYVGIGQLLFSADNISKAEVEAQIPLSVLRRLMGASFIDKEQTTEDLDISRRFNFSSIKSEVFLVGSQNTKWPASVQRVASGLDQKTRAGRVVVSVSEPYRGANLPVRPALQPDMYVEVTLSILSPDPLLAIPVSSVHQGSVYLVDADNKLQRRKVEVSFVQRDLAVISSGLKPGEIIITDDLLMAVNGMSVAQRRNSELEGWVKKTSLGESL
ncbi:efflux RND transporter periplasmic adaptor subunit [Vibrio zhugei]|uniref:Efflux RND transporter periplasmic adaptor subunit n=1 Tax=Vibrio zhugei TaxID=2479546 RepID=A0ABV7CDI6_9VIBR|nr:HlyD family efflux transporter periplasmic adaptor subunit [Vibrio zhugei]